MDDPLLHVLSEIQRRGGIGRVRLEDAVAHADQYVAALPAASHGGRLIDLGSGGGLPGLVIVARRPDLEVTLVERRDKRADLLRFGVRALDASDRVTVLAADVRAVLARVADGETGASGASGGGARFDVVTARSFGPLDEVARFASQLVRPGGWLIVSEPPDGDDGLDHVAMASRHLVDDGRVIGPAGSVHRWRHEPVDDAGS